ncbi:MAG: hypothetical protein NVS4B11_13030 [Ktedonobacteraceae bacterium]
MHFSTRSKVRILLPLITILALVSAFMVSAVFRGAEVRASAPVTKFQGTHDTITQSQLVHYNLHGTDTSNTASRPRTSIEPGSNSKSSTNNTLHPPHAPGLEVDRSQAGVLHNFPGLNSVDSFRVNGFLLEPPDQGLCVGSLVGTKVVGEIVNDVVAFYSPNGSLFSGKENLNTFFNEPSTEFMTDPRCTFDTSTQTFFFTSLAITSFSPLSNHVDIAVLHTNLSELVARVDVTFAHNTAGRCPCLGDQPKLGIDKYNVYISVDQYDKTLTFETGAALIAVSKAQLVAGSHGIEKAVFTNLALAGIGIVGLQPAITNGNANTEFLLNSFPYTNLGIQPVAFTNKLGLWAVTHPQTVAADGRPELTASLINSETYGFPVPALTTNGKSLATFSNDDRMQQVQYINGHLWGSLDSAVVVNGDPRKVDGIAWFEVKPILAGDDISTGILTDQGYIASAGKYLLYPAIETNFQGTTGIAFSLTSPTLNPSTGYVVRHSEQGAFSDIHITGLGSGPDIGFTCALGFPQQCRYGDYSAAALDPNGQNIWMAAEDIVPQVATQVVPGVGTFRTNWGTRVWDVNGD